MMRSSSSCLTRAIASSSVMPARSAIVSVSLVIGRLEEVRPWRPSTPSCAPGFVCRSAVRRFRSRLSTTRASSREPFQCPNAVSHPSSRRACPESKVSSPASCSFDGLDVEVKSRAVAPSRRRRLFSTGQVEVGGRPEVPTLRENALSGEQRFRQLEIAGKRIEHVLPRPNGTRTSDSHRFAPGPSANAVGNQLIRCPVATANHIAGAQPRQSRHRELREKAAAHARGQNFGAALRRTVRIVATDRIAFDVRLHRLAIFVTLVRRHDQRRATPTAPAGSTPARGAFPSRWWHRCRPGRRTMDAPRTALPNGGRRRVSRDAARPSAFQDRECHPPDSHIPSAATRSGSVLSPARAKIRSPARQAGSAKLPATIP